MSRPTAETINPLFKSLLSLHGSLAAEKMQGMWVSMKENISCRNCLYDPDCQPKQRKIMYQPPTGSIYRKRVTAPSTFTEVEEEDISRKVIEKILGDGLTSPTKKITKVYRVKNSDEVVDAFEAFRKTVKKRAKSREGKHTRSMVDGNELLGFYVTTIACFSRDSKPICEYSDCNLCQVIGFSFDRKNVEKTGIQLSINSEALRESIKEESKPKKSKKAVIICRIIAGRVKGVSDKRNDDEGDSILRKGVHLNSQHLTVSSHNAVLPCFLVILN